MAQVMVKETSDATQVPREANCTVCLTRNCAMVGSLTFPVRLCSSFRQANCYICNQSECVLKGSLESPVRVCDQFQWIAA